MTQVDLDAAPKRCRLHREEVLASDLCACFYCLVTFSPTDIREWCDSASDGTGKTALCPRCGIDSVIGSASSLPVGDEAFLGAMHKRWFQ